MKRRYEADNMTPAGDVAGGLRRGTTVSHNESSYHPQMPYAKKTRLEASLSSPAAGIPGLDFDLTDYCFEDVITTESITDGVQAGTIMLPDVLSACASDNVEALKYYVATGVDIWRERNTQGMNPLMVAAQNGQMNVLRWMTENFEVDFHVTDMDGRSVLMHPCRNGHLEIVQWLVERGANPRAATKKGCTPLLTAARSGDVPMLKYLSQFQPLSYSGEFGQTALHYAAANGRIAAVEWLCAQPGVNIDIKSADGFTAKDLAQRSGHPFTELFTRSSGTVVKVEVSDVNNAKPCVCPIYATSM